MHAIATAVDAALNPGLKNGESNFSFVLIVAENGNMEKINDKTNLMYIANGDRRDVTILARALLVKFESFLVFSTKGK